MEPAPSKTFRRVYVGAPLNVAPLMADYDCYGYFRDVWLQDVNSLWLLTLGSNAPPTLEFFDNFPNSAPHLYSAFILVAIRVTDDLCVGSQPEPTEDLC